MRSRTAKLAVAVLFFVAIAAAGVAACSDAQPPVNQNDFGAAIPADSVTDEAIPSSTPTLVPAAQVKPARLSADELLRRQGQSTFRYDTFGDEAFWGEAGLGLNRAIAGSINGGFGEGVSPTAALRVGLKVDAAALPAELVASIKAGQVNLNDPSVTIALLGLDAVVGLKGTVENGKLTTLGITCALCHSTVDDSFGKGIGNRLDGWANRDLDVGAIVNLAQDLAPVSDLLGVDQPTVRTALKSWGPGRFDALLFLDGKAFRPDGKTAAVLIPPAFGLAGVNLHTSTGWGSIPYWNAFVAVLEMHGQGNFTDPRLDDAAQFPVAARNKSGHTRVEKDLVSAKLPALQAYQLSLRAPSGPVGTYDTAAATRGAAIFEGQARCSSCHTQPLLTESGWNMHKPSDIGIDDFQANRSPDKRYRTTPLRGLWTHTKGGFYHDGRFATLMDVVVHYNNALDLGLTLEQKNDLIAYLSSL